MAEPGAARAGLAATRGAEVVLLDDADELAEEAARRLATVLEAAIAERDVAHVALTGGSSAVALYRELAAEWRDALDWARVHLWWGDERFVPVDHPESNIGLAYSLLLLASARSGESGVGAQGVDVDSAAMPGLPIRAENVHPYLIDEARSESDAAQLVAQRYAEELLQLLPTDGDGLPRFDSVLLGVGGDGHIMSVFPDSPALDDDAPLVLAVPAPDDVEPRLPRLTLNPRLLAAAGQVIVMVGGSDKVDIVGRLLGAANGDPRQLPALLALRPNAVWLLDREAAAQLPQG